MAERRVALGTDFSATIRTNDGTVLSDLVTNPGSLDTEVATSTGLNILIVQQILDFAVKAGIVIARPDFGGTVRYWRADTWVDRILTYISDARSWVDALGSSGAMEGSLVTDLETAGLASNESETVAQALVNALVNEGIGETA